MVLPVQTKHPSAGDSLDRTSGYQQNGGKVPNPERPVEAGGKCDHTTARPIPIWALNVPSYPRWEQSREEQESPGESDAMMRVITPRGCHDCLYLVVYE